MKRADLHCHSDASNRPAEAMLGAINCPECYSCPDEVYRQARGRGMDFVTISDHDTIAGVKRIADRPDVLVGEELTCWFPEDACKMHVLVFGITDEDHAELQRRAKNIYDVAEYVERRSIAHSVAHPIYRQNDKLERWHLERLLLIFKGFECLNGAHSPLHREAFEPLLDRLTPAELERLSSVHGMRPRWPEPWKKARTGGSDDHGLLNIGRTWTEFPDDTHAPADVLFHLRHGNCAPGGEAGSSAKLAHTFYSVAVRYYSRHIMVPGKHKANLATGVLQMLAGERKAPTKTEIAGAYLKSRVRRITQKLTAPFRREDPKQAQQRGLIKRLFLQSAMKRMGEAKALRDAADAGLPPLGEHEDVLRLAAHINRDISEGIAAAINKSVDDASFVDLFDAISAILAQQFVLSPYYFAAFHQNKERHLLRSLTGRSFSRTSQTLKVGLFTDTFDEVNGVSRFLKDMAEQARAAGRQLTIHTCGPTPIQNPKSAIQNFSPLLSWPMPYYPELKANIPPALEILEWADRQQFDAVHVSTPGPMGLAGWLVSKMLRVPMIATYHTDFPAYVDRLTGDHRVTNGCVAYMKWFYGQATTVLSRSNEYRFPLHDLGVPDDRIVSLPAGVNGEKFSPKHRDHGVWARLGVDRPIRLLYAGRVSVEKNLPFLVEFFRKVSALRNDVALIVAGDGPYLETMRQETSGLPVTFLGYQNDTELARLYASADLLVFPSCTDTLGQVVMEAQASGLPAIVSNIGGPRETVEHESTGLVLPCESSRWVDEIADLLDDRPRRLRMRTAAIARAERFSLLRTFESFWEQHLNAVEKGAGEAVLEHAPAGALAPAS